MSRLGVEISGDYKRSLEAGFRSTVQMTVGANRQRNARHEVAAAAAVLLAGFVGFTDVGNKAARSSLDVLDAARDAVTSGAMLREAPAPAKPAKGITQALRHDR